MRHGQGVYRMISIKRQQQRAVHTDLWSCRCCQTLQLVSEGLVISLIGIAGPERTGAKSHLVRVCFQLPFTNALYLGNRRYNTSGGLRRRAILDLQGSPFNVVLIQFVDNCNFIAVAVWSDHPHFSFLLSSFGGITRLVIYRCEVLPLSRNSGCSGARGGDG